MIDLENLTPFGRKQWVKRQFDKYEASKLAKSIDLSVKVYSKPDDLDTPDDGTPPFDCKLDKPKWKATIDKKVNYLLARKPVLANHQEQLDELLDFIKLSAREYLLRGSLIWIVQGDGESIEPKPAIMSNTIAVYADENKEEPVAFIRKYTDTELVPETGEEQEVVYYECYYGDRRDTFCYTLDNRDKEEVFSQAPVIIELGKTNDAPLFSYVANLLQAFDHTLSHQDETTAYNTDPLVEVRGYTGTSDEDLDYVVKTSKIAKTDGNGGVTIHTRTMDSNSIDLWQKRIMNEYYEATCTVGKDNELAYAQSGKAMDRLFIDMENSARDLAHVLEQALKDYFSSIGIEDFDIVWNTDRPVDDVSIINAIAASSGILSEKTLLEQHPWVDDVDKELKRKAEEAVSGMDDLTEDNNDEEEL